jgi:hypothetical protein
MDNHHLCYITKLKKRTLMAIDARVWEILTQQTKHGVYDTVAVPFALKSILRQKKNYENSHISPCESIIFKKSSKTNQNPSRYHNSITNLNFQHKPKHHLQKILI